MLVAPRGRAVGQVNFEGRVQGQARPLQGGQVPQDQRPAGLVNPGVNQGLDDDLRSHPHGSPMVRARMGLSVDVVMRRLIPFGFDPLHLDVNLTVLEGNLEIVMEKMLGVGPVEGRPGSASDGIGDAFPGAGKVAVDMTGENMADAILTKQGGQPASGGLRQAVVFATPPGVKEGNVEEHQASFVSL